MKNGLRRIAFLLLTGGVLLGAWGCGNRQAAAPMPATTPPPEIQDLRKNPNVPPAQAQFLMGDGKSAPPGPAR